MSSLVNQWKLNIITTRKNDNYDPENRARLINYAGFCGDNLIAYLSPYNYTEMILEIVNTKDFSIYDNLSWKVPISYYSKVITAENKIYVFNAEAHTLYCYDVPSKGISWINQDEVFLNIAYSNDQGIIVECKRNRFCLIGKETGNLDSNYDFIVPNLNSKFIHDYYLDRNSITYICSNALIYKITRNSSGEYLNNYVINAGSFETNRAFITDKYIVCIARRGCVRFYDQKSGVFLFDYHNNVISPDTVLISNFERKNRYFFIFFNTLAKSLWYIAVDLGEELIIYKENIDVNEALRESKQDEIYILGTKSSLPQAMMAIEKQFKLITINFVL